MATNTKNNSSSSSSSSRMNGKRGEEKGVIEEISKGGVKEGERILGATRRADGSLRKPIRIRAGYVPQDEVAKYQSKGTLWKKEMESLQGVPPGYSPPVVVDGKSKSKSAKRNERKKEKRQQAALDKDKNLDKSEDGSEKSESVAGVVSQMDDLAISADAAEMKPTPNSVSAPVDVALDIDKKIRALKKKIRLAESQLEKTADQDMKPEQLEKMTKLGGWREELKQLENRKAELS